MTCLGKLKAFRVINN